VNVDQLTVFDGIEEMSSSAVGDPVDTVAAHANSEWVEWAREVIRDFGAGHRFIAEDVRVATDIAGFKTSDRRALGAVIRAASAAGEIEMTGQLRRAASSHGSHKPEWRRT
jgi:hypothetical protein